jgi:catechol 2,3-dioxygenase
MTEVAAMDVGTAPGTWRAPLHRLDHATLRVTDVAEAVAWYEAALDLQVLEQSAEHAVLTVGGDGRADLVLRAGGTGLHAFALGIASIDALDDLAETLAARDVPFERPASDVPGVDAVLELATPGPQKLQVVASTAGPTGVMNAARPGGVAPVDTDHTTLLVPDVRGFSRWLARTLGFATSDAVAAPGAPGAWISSWTHITPQHHDVALIATDDAAMTLHHTAFLAADLNHMGEVADRVCSLSDDARCEWGIGKHGGLGANNYLYFKDPSGNRIELNSNMDANPFDRDIDIYPGEEFASFISIWNHEPPPATFLTGS